MTYFLFQNRYCNYPYSLGLHTYKGINKFYFYNIKDALRLIYDEAQIYILSVPDDEPIRNTNGHYRAERIVIESILPLEELATWKFLIKEGAEIHEAAIKWAIRKGNIQILQYLLSLNSTIPADALHIASEIHMVKYLIERGADIHADNDLAIWQVANREIAEYLVEKGANIHAVNERAFVWAAGHGNLEVVKYLVEQGADIQVADNSALIDAAIDGNTEIVKYLIEHGADPRGGNREAIFWARKRGVKVVDLIVD